MYSASKKPAIPHNSASIVKQPRIKTILFVFLFFVIFPGFFFAIFLYCQYYSIILFCQWVFYRKASVNLVAATYLVAVTYLTVSPSLLLRREPNSSEIVLIYSFFFTEHNKPVQIRVLSGKNVIHGLFTRDIFDLAAGKIIARCKAVRVFFV